MNITSSHIKTRNQETLINNKKFNRIFEEYIDKELSQTASKLVGDYWIALISVYDILNAEIEDFELCNFLKKKATIKLLNSQNNGESISLALGGDTNDFIDFTIYENFARKKNFPYLKIFFSFGLGILFTLFSNLPFVFLGLWSGGNAIYNGNYVYFNLVDFTVLFAVMVVTNPAITDIAGKICEKFNAFVSYTALLLLVLFVSIIYLIFCNFITSITLFTMPIHIGLYLILIVAFSYINYRVYKKIK